MRTEPIQTDENALYHIDSSRGMGKLPPLNLEPFSEILLKAQAGNEKAKKTLQKAGLKEYIVNGKRII